MIPIDSGKVIQIILGLVLVLLVIGGLTWFLRHVMRFQPTVGGQLQILGGLSMGPRERVVLLKVGDTQMLLGVSPGRIQTLHVLDKPVVETPEVATLPDSGFSRHLSRFLRSDRGRRQDG
ncbi:MAG: flagellar biosynthetic protein FliO [Gammaproteobacteria bacterium]|nr:flagellar biosynthetic protein FliO [Gammaproteobacteria bacterium]